MKVIVVDNPFVGMLLEMMLGAGVVREEGAPVKVETDVKPDLKANPDFYTKPGVPKQLVLKVFSNTDAGKMYDVTRDRGGNLYCTCTGFKYRGKCSHIAKVQGFGGVTTGGMGMCINCNHFTRDERNINIRGKKACKRRRTILCPPLGGCRHFESMGSFKAETKEMPMTFPVSGTLLQTFQSRHFPEVQYEVRLKDGDLVCTCRGFNFHGTCKHVQYMNQRVNRNTITI